MAVFFTTPLTLRAASTLRRKVKSEIRYVRNSNSSEIFQLPLLFARMIEIMRLKVDNTKMVHVGNDQEMAQSERNTHSKNPGGKNLIDN